MTAVQAYAGAPGAGVGATGNAQHDQAHDGLRRLVTSGLYPPGTLLSEQDLSHRLGVGRSPIRDAVARLVHEGLLTRLPRRGVMVRSLSIEELRDLYEVREALELVAVRRAVERADEELTSGLRAQLEEARELIEAGGEWSHYQKLDRVFHATLWHTTGNARAVTMLAQLADAALLHDTRLPPNRAGDRMAGSVAEHALIVEAMEQRDVDAAVEAFGHHVRAYQRALIERINGRSRDLS